MQVSLKSFKKTVLIALTISFLLSLILIPDFTIAYSLTFKDENRTLNEEEVMEVFNKIIDKVTNSHNAILRDK